MSKISFRTDPENALAAYWRDGYFVEQGMFPPEECEDMVSWGCGLVDEGERNFAPIMMPHRRDTAFLAVMRDPRCVNLMRALLGDEIAGLQSEFFFSKPGTIGFAAHQDNFYVEADRNSFASAWLALVDVSEENGGLIVYPGTHEENRLETRPRAVTVEDSGQDANANNEEVVVPAKYERVAPVIPRGSIVLIHGNLVHGSGVNRSNSFRYALLNTYLRKGARFRPGATARREPVSLESE